MRNSNDIRRGRHWVFKMHVHLVLVTKYRREGFTKEILEELRNLFAGVCKDFEAQLVEFDGEDDHLHLLVNYHPQVAVSTLVNSLKASQAAGFDRRGTRASVRSYGAAPCGHLAISPEVAAVPLFRSFASILNSRRPRVRTASRPALCIPALNGGVFRANSDKDF